MERNERKSNYSIKSKLVSAIAMLLVATIMVVSSTYAWFTLSTAPEVSGVSTAVGANGALEMLLATKDAEGNWVYGNGSVNGKTQVERNTYWGNLVDLSDASYGSQAITLLPSKLNLTDGSLSLLSPLQTPVFGADGRVENLATGGNFAKYNGNAFMQVADYYGFRGLGVASGLTERQQAFRTAISAMATAQYNAQTTARNSLSANGTRLARIAIVKAMQGDTAKVLTAEDVTGVGSMIDGLEASLKQVETAYVEAIIAYILGKGMNHATDLEATTMAAAVRTSVTSAGTDLNARLTAVFTLLDDKAAAAQAALGAGYTKYTAAVAAVAQAKTAYASVDTGKTEYAWDDVSAALSPLVNVTAIKINNIVANEVTQEANKTQIASDILGGKGVKVTIPTTGGIYADIADLSGDYTVDIEINSTDLNVGVNGLTIKATMTADSTLDKPYLTAVNEALNATSNQPDGDTAGALPLTEMYGYVIDLAFRTNAAQSNLLLQTEAKDRIYGDNNNEATMGKGSTMTFKSASSDFTTDNVKNLMKNLRVVFYETAPATSFAQIYATAKLDLDNDVVVDANGVTAKLYIFKSARKYTYADGAETVYKLGDKYYVNETCTTEAVIPEGAQLVSTNDVVEVRDNVITALNQGEKKHISALVYLDGESITNADVAATVAQSMSGTVNFQFASSAELTPMEYGNLHTPNN